LETGFQRTVVGLAGAGLLVLAAIVGYLVYSEVALTQFGEKLLASRKDAPLDNLAIVVAVGCLLGYWATYRYCRPRKADAGLGDAVGGILTMGLPGMVAVAVGIVAGWLDVTYAVQIAAVLVAALLVVQGGELIVNAMRSYAAIEEFDQAPLDLQKLPLTPMLTSLWVLGLRSLLAQSVGLARRDVDVTGGAHHPGALARLLPRVLIALVVLAVLASMMRVVKPGEVAIRERLGEATKDDIAHPLQPGLHITWPWPLDKLVHIPTGHVQQVNVGTEEPTQYVNGKPLDFQFWSSRHTAEGQNEQEYVTGDKPSAQLLGAFVVVWWRVTDPTAFYNHLSHSTFTELDETAAGAKAVNRPIYEALIQQLAMQAVTQTFTRHRLDEIMGSEQQHVAEHCRETLQARLDALQSGVGILELSIKDVHPPMGAGPKQATAAGVVMGPAAAYEDVIAAREDRETAIDEASRKGTILMAAAKGEASSILSDATTYRAWRVAQASAEANQLVGLAKAYGANPSLTRYWKTVQMLDTALPGVRKVIIGPGIPPPDVWQPGRAGAGGSDAVTAGMAAGNPTGSGGGPPGPAGGGGARPGP